MKHAAGRKVVIVSHSMGGTFMLYFLQWVTKERGHLWLHTHIHALIKIAVPALGVPKSVVNLSLSLFLSFSLLFLSLSIYISLSLSISFPLSLSVSLCLSLSVSLSLSLSLPTSPRPVSTAHSGCSGHGGTAAQQCTTQQDNSDIAAQALTTATQAVQSHARCSQPPSSSA